MFYIRDTVILTAYVAMLMAGNQALDVIILVATAASAFFLMFVFGIQTIRYLFWDRYRSREIMVPLGLMMVIPVVLGLVEPRMVVCALIGAMAATLPLLVNLESRDCDLDQRTLGIGYWCLLVAMLAATLTALIHLISLVYVWGRNWNYTDEQRLIRQVAIAGIIASVMMGWWLTNRIAPVDESAAPSR